MTDEKDLIDFEIVRKYNSVLCRLLIDDINIENSINLIGLILKRKKDFRHSKYFILDLMLLKNISALAVGVFISIYVDIHRFNCNFVILLNEKNIKRVRRYYGDIPDIIPLYKNKDECFDYISG